MKMKAIGNILVFTLLFGLAALNGSGQSKFIDLVVSLTGSVYNEITHVPISVEMKAFDEEGKVVYRGKSNAAQKGYYFITGLKPGKTYTVRFGDFEYFNQKYDVTIPNTDKYSEFSHDFLVKPKQKGLEFLIEVSPFELNKSKIRVGADLFLQDFVSTLKENSRVKFMITTYPDNDNKLDLNKRITEERAQALKAYFVSKGINESRISLKSESTTDPKNPPPSKKRAKGKRYTGSSYIVIVDI